ncbi:MAG: hypothetical protein ACHBN1_19015 [Heteroscytonema crispum UTEX LB 1556]
MKSKVSNRNNGLWLVVCIFSLLISNPANPTPSPSTTGRRGENNPFYPLVNNKQNSPPSLPAKRGVRFSCSDKNLELFLTPLLRDLPSYANRASQRARRLSRQTDVYSYVVVAGRPEFTPLPLNPSGYTTDAPKSASDEEVKQVFFTTLERQYTGRKAIELQQFHWLFLTKTKFGWRMVMMFSQIGSYPVQRKPTTPPRDSSNGIIAQAVNAWLRDCEAGSVRF